MVDYNVLQSTNITDMCQENNELFVSEKNDYHYEKALNINTLEVISTLFATYILASDGLDFYIIDQHAAHERVLYERFRDTYENASVPKQMLLTPYLFSPPATIKNLDIYNEFLDKLGFEIDEFGENTWACRSFPAYISHTEGESFLLETIEALSEEKNEISANASERIIMRACKSAIKANRNLSDGEIQMLLKDLSLAENPYTCPHGRPVFIKLTRQDIEKLFKRA